MQIIQGIREKGAAVVIGVIALSLIGFILMDAKQGNSSSLFGGSSSNSVAKVNGSNISQEEFLDKVNIQEDQEKQQNQQPLTATRQNQIKDQIWNQLVALKVFYAEADKLGIKCTGKELDAVFFSTDQMNPFLQGQGFMDKTTGQLDVNAVAAKIRELKKTKNPEEKKFFENSIETIKQGSIVNKYNGLLSAGAYYPTWMQEQDSADNKTFASISYVAIPYAVVPDSTITVSDKEIEEYVSKHKKQFKQEEGRTISYLTFSQLPSAADSAGVKAELERIKPQFTTDTNNAAFVAKNGSVNIFQDEFFPKSKIPTVAADTVAKQAIGAVYGPYVDGKNYSLAKVVATKAMPDSIKARHILIPVKDAQGQPTDPAVAKNMADSILKMIKGGQRFDSLAKKYGTDATKDKGGDLGTFGYGAMVPEFNSFCFTKPVGTIEVVQTNFGYHVVEITGQKNMSTAYKVALMSKEIVPSEATIAKANQDALKLSAFKSVKELDDYIAKNGLSKVSMPTLIKETDYQVGMLQDARQVVRWAYENKEGSISEPFSIGDQYVVAIVDRVYKEGTQDAKAARPMAERAIRNKKIAEGIIKKIGANPTLETAAAAYGKQVMVAGADSTLTFSSSMVNGLGVEPRVVGASFNKENQTKVSAPIEGGTGVYYIKVNSIGTKTADTPEQKEQAIKGALTGMRSQVTANWYEGLKNQATIKDKRAGLGY